jgi:single-stranded DNA-specific DHH superfamily exonuclease
MKKNFVYGIVIMAFLSSCGVSQSDYDKLQMQIEQLKNENERLLTELNDYKNIDKEIDAEVKSSKSKTEIKSNRTQENKKVKSISTKKFKKSVIGKTKGQIKDLYGKPCQTQTISGIGNMWYYGHSSCFKDKNRTIIYDEDSEKEVSQAQIMFSGDIATTVNFM